MKNITITLQHELEDDGTPCVCWFVQLKGEENDEPIAGGYTRTTAAALNDASVWVNSHP